MSLAAIRAAPARRPQRRAAPRRRAWRGAPLLVIAGAGAGKTNMLAHRVAHLILDGADPKRIMLATFSRRAAGELNRRVQRLLAAQARARGGRRRDAGLRRHVSFDRRAAVARICAAARARSAIHHPRPRGLGRPDGTLRATSAGLSQTKERFPTKGTCVCDLFARRQRARRRSPRRSGGTFPGRRRTRRRCAACSRPMSRPSSARACSITTICCSISRRCWPSPTIAAEVAGRFDHLLVDEYQDTNRLQAEIVLALRPDGRGLTVVGDDAQSIYSFRAATVRNILDFPQSFRSAGARRHARAQLPLDRSRSSPPPTPSSRSRPSASPRTCGASARPARRRDLATSARRPIRRATSRRACSRIARRGRA